MVERRLTDWLRPALALFGFTGVLLLSACGGGNGAPNNPYLPPPAPIPPLLLLPSTMTVYPGTPATLTISGGVGPYRAFTTDATTLPVASTVASDTIVLSANSVAVPTSVTLSVQDTLGTLVAGTISVQPAPLLSTGVTVTSNPNPACAVAEATLCSGSTGTAVVKVTGNGGVGIAGRQVRFDVVQGTYSIVSTNPAQPLVSTLTVTTDVNGDATVVLSVPADTPTQSALIRATDLTSGNQITGSFVIQQITVGGQTLAVLPTGTTTINGPDNQRCSTGASVTNYIFGGTPPYQVAVNFPGAVTLSGVPVLKSGGAFTTTTNGTCFVNLTYVITDSKGLTIPPGQYPFVTNQLGTSAPTPPPPTALVVTPGAIAKNNCVPANTFQFIGTGGTAPYSAIVSSTSSSTSPVLAPQNGLTAGQAVTVSGLTSPSSTIITLFDASSPRQSATVSIDCSGAPPTPPPSALVIAPSNYNYSTTSCVNQTANFVVTGGTAPYNVFFASPRPGATIAPTTLTASGQGFAVTGLTNGVQTTNVTVADSSTPQLVQIATITCPSVPNPPPALTVAPAGFTYTAAVCGAATTSSNFVVSGGTPPYTIYFSVPGTLGVIAPTTVVASGLGFSVTGLAGTPKLNQITIQDSSPTPLLQFVTITCT